MKTLTSEKELIAAALALISPATRLSDAEFALTKGVDAQLNFGIADNLRSEIEQGEDPLGVAFSHIRSRVRRRTSGATYTPAPVVSSMVSWAASQPEPGRVVDVGAGSGRFLLSAGLRFPNARLVAVEEDPIAALMLRANIAVAGLENRTSVFVADYLKMPLPAIESKTLFIGNPPYLRHHEISDRTKSWYAETAATYGVKASKLAGLHIHFFLRTLQLAKKGDHGVFITSAEWLDVNYGSALRKLLGGELGGVALHVIDPTATVFEDATTTSAITCFQVGERPEKLRVRAVPSLAKLNCLSKGEMIPWDAVSMEPRWSIIVRPGPKPPPNFIELGEICRVHRGQVTGANGVWLEGPHTINLPKAVMQPAVTKAIDLIRAGDRLTAAENLRRVVDIPQDLAELDRESLAPVERFLKWAKLNGADLSYTAQHRSAWWSVGLRRPAPIICTYMARRAPAFVRNMCEARHINIAHGLYPRDSLSPTVLDSLAFWLRNNVSTKSGRMYAGGLIKFEPKEMERLLVPRLENFGNDPRAEVDYRTAS